jgi:hypothetical protein
LLPIHLLISKPFGRTSKLPFNCHLWNSFGYAAEETYG